MSGFSAEWLALREPLDMRARNREVLDAVAAAFRGQAGAVDRRSRQRHRLDRAGARARGCRNRNTWMLVDNDPVLLAEAFALARPAGVAVETQQFDLNDDVGPLFDGADLVTASALIDLVSEPWLANLRRGRGGARAAGLYRADL